MLLVFSNKEVNFQYLWFNESSSYQSLTVTVNLLRAK